METWHDLWRAIIYQTILEGLDGHGIGPLAWLLSPEGQTAIQETLHLDPEAVRHRTCQTIRRIMRLRMEDRAHEVIKLISWRKSTAEVYEVFHR